MADYLERVHYGNYKERRIPEMNLKKILREIFFLIRAILHDNLCFKLKFYASYVNQKYFVVNKEPIRTNKYREQN